MTTLLAPPPSTRILSPRSCESYLEIDASRDNNASSSHHQGYHPPSTRRRIFNERCILYSSVATLASLLIAAVAVITTISNGAGPRGGSGRMYSVKASSPQTETIDRDVDPLWRVRPTNLHVAFLGDSTTHYQYLSLAYFLRTGRWFEPMRPLSQHTKSHLTNVYSFESIFHNDVYGEFFFQTTRLLQPQEICDCYYPKGLNDAYRMAPHQIIINRYFHDPERNNTLRFFHSFGHESEMQGRVYSENITDMQGMGCSMGCINFRRPMLSGAAKIGVT